MTWPTAPLGNVTWWPSFRCWRPTGSQFPRTTVINQQIQQIFILHCPCAKVRVMNHRTTQENITHCLTLKEFTIQLGRKRRGLNAIVFNSISLCVLSTKTMFEMLRDEISINQHGLWVSLGASSWGGLRRHKGARGRRAVATKAKARRQNWADLAQEALSSTSGSEEYGIEGQGGKQKSKMQVRYKCSS